MAKTYYYLIDRLNESKAQQLEKALRATDSIESAQWDKLQKIITIEASKNPENQVKMACSIIGGIFRTSVDKKHI